MKIEIRNLIILNSLVIVVCILIGTFKAFALPNIYDYFDSRHSIIKKETPKKVQTSKKDTRIKAVEDCMQQPVISYQSIDVAETQKEINKQAKQLERQKKKELKRQIKLEKKLQKQNEKELRKLQREQEKEDNEG